MVEAVAQEFGRVLKQYGGYLEVLLDDFASRYVSSGASSGFSDHVWSDIVYRHSVKAWCHSSPRSCLFWWAASFVVSGVVL